MPMTLILSNLSKQLINKLFSKWILSSWFNANNFFSNVSKTELVMFNPLKKQLDHKLKKLNDKKLYQTKSVNPNLSGLCRGLFWGGVGVGLGVKLPPV